MFDDSVYAVANNDGDGESFGDVESAGDGLSAGMVANDDGDGESTAGDGESEAGDGESTGDGESEAGDGLSAAAHTLSAVAEPAPLSTSVEALHVVQFVHDNWLDAVENCPFGQASHVRSVLTVPLVEVY